MKTSKIKHLEAENESLRDGVDELLLDNQGLKRRFNSMRDLLIAFAVLVAITCGVIAIVHPRSVSMDDQPSYKLAQQLFGNVSWETRVVDGKKDDTYYRVTIDELVGSWQFSPEYAAKQALREKMAQRADIERCAEDPKRKGMFECRAKDSSYSYYYSITSDGNTIPAGSVTYGNSVVLH